MARPSFTIAEFLADPDTTLRRVREEGPIASGEMGSTIVRHEAVRAILQDGRLQPSFPLFLQQFGVSSGAFYDWMSISALNMDGEEHGRWRRLMIKTFTPRSVERLRPFLRTEANRLIDQFV